MMSGAHTKPKPPSFGDSCAQHEARQLFREVETWLMTLGGQQGVHEGRGGVSPI